MLSPSSLDCGEIASATGASSRPTIVMARFAAHGAKLVILCRIGHRDRLRGVLGQVVVRAVGIEGIASVGVDGDDAAAVDGRRVTLSVGSRRGLDRGAADDADDQEIGAEDAVAGVVGEDAAGRDGEDGVLVGRIRVVDRLRRRRRWRQDPPTELLRRRHAVSSIGGGDRHLVRRLVGGRGHGAGDEARVCVDR